MKIVLSGSSLRNLIKGMDALVGAVTLYKDVASLSIGVFSDRKQFRANLIVVGV